MRSVDVPPTHDARWTPASRIGRWAVGLASAAVLGLAVSVIGFATGMMQSASSFSDNWALTLWGLGILAAGAASAVAGATALIGRHDRSWAVGVATLVGACALLVMLNEVVQGVR